MTETEFETECSRRMRLTKFVVEATTDECQFLWEKFSDQAMYKTPLNTYRWEQLNPGWAMTIGELAGMPVVLAVRWYRIDGVLVMFYESTSQVTDRRMVDKWLEHYVTCKDEDGRPAQCNTANIHHALNFIKKSQTSTPPRYHD